MVTAIIDYNSGNLTSVSKSFQYVSNSQTDEAIIITRDPKEILKADKIVLPGVGAYAHCKEELDAIEGMYDAIETRVIRQAVPFLGICVGMQLMTSTGYEHGAETNGFNWISGTVTEIPRANNLRIPHMGWNSLDIKKDHVLFSNIEQDAHVYFVHSYQAKCDDPNQVVATTKYGNDITAAISKDNMIGTQFHPEKSQEVGLRIISNFLNWNP